MLLDKNYFPQKKLFKKKNYNKLALNQQTTYKKGKHLYVHKKKELNIYSTVKRI